MDSVVLVDERDEEVGVMEKIEAHQKGVLHRAFSVFIFNGKGEMLLQQRSVKKYHSGGLWTNACCSHPKPNELTLNAANRRLIEEMGFETPLEKAFDFIYKTTFLNGLTENEFDHVFIGNYDGTITPDYDEVENYAFRTIEKIEEAVKLFPDFYTEWFLIAFPKVKEWLIKNNKY